MGESPYDSEQSSTAEIQLAYGTSLPLLTLLKLLMPPLIFPSGMEPLAATRMEATFGKLREEMLRYSLRPSAQTYAHM